MKVVLDEQAVMPQKAHELDAGWDLFARTDFVVPACHADTKKTEILDYDNPIKSIDGEVIGFEYKEAYLVKAGSASHDTGVHIEIPKGNVGFLKSKSGLNVNHGLTSDGVIDAGYTGSIVVKLYNHTNKNYYFHKGDKITQLVILPYSMENMELADSLAETDRGDNGFGSSGK